ncbi:MAG: chlorite dismutase family protein [Planctomycetota bacterium]
MSLDAPDAPAPTRAPAGPAPTGPDPARAEAPPTRGRPQVEPADVREHGGRGAASDRRLLLQLVAYTGVTDPQPLLDAVAQSGLDVVVYADALDPRGLALLWSGEDDAPLVGPWRALQNEPAFASLTTRPGLTMTGRTYAVGYETDLDDVLVDRPRRRLADADLPWCVWYPLRRSGAFERLPAEEKKSILAEHGTIGMSFGAAGHAHDVRLAAHGLNHDDADFIVGLLGPKLAPLSVLVHRMRATRQTAEYIESLGPFFVGRKLGAYGPHLTRT